MDELDLYILKKLMVNSRLTYRDLAEDINISVSAVHKRIKHLEDIGTINAFVARPSLISLKGIWVMTTGTSTATSVDQICQELGKHESIYFIGIASGKYLYIAAYLRDITEMQDYSIYVANTSHISDPTFGIITIPYITTPESLSTIDYKILKTLNRDSRKKIIDIAEEVGISAKTVRKSINRMNENKLAYFTIEWTPKSENDFITIFHIYLKEGSDISSVVRHLMEKYANNTAYCVTFSNIPNYLTMHTWAKTSKDSQKIQEELQIEGFKDIVPRIILNGYYYDSWIDQLLRAK